jgi:CRP/FNR family transcriptional regulator, cyclic AMP receptor protein
MANPPVDFRLLAGAGVPARDFKAGDVIFRQGDPAHELFIVQSGEVEIRLGNRVLERLPQYSIFGEMAMIDSAARSATAIAASDAKLVPVSEKQFLFLISNTPYFALNVMRVMAQRLRAANTAL